jgi:TonB family protein
MITVILARVDAMMQIFKSIARKRSTVLPLRIRGFAAQAVLASLLCLFCAWHLWGGSGDICVRDLVVPGYPPLARMAKLEGSVTVEIEINADGKVTSAKAAGADPILQRAAETNIRLWTFGSRTESADSPQKHTVVYVYKLTKEYMRCAQVILHLPDRVEISQEPPKIVPATDSEKK